jgi:hypothetical protein
MRKIFIEMDLNLAYLTPVHDTFHIVIPSQSSTPIGRIDLEVSCRPGENKHKEMLMFEDTNFDIRYNCILERPFLLKFMTVIHTVYDIIKMPNLRGVFTIKADQRDVLACENASLSYAGRFGEKAVQEQATKVAKIKGGNTPSKISASKPLTGNSPRIPPASKGTNMYSNTHRSEGGQ